MGFSEIFKKGEHLVAEHSAAILTAVGITGTVTTAILTGRASFKAAEIIAETEEERFGSALEENTTLDVSVLSTRERVMLVWPHFVPPVASGITTVVAIAFAHRINASKSAALAAAYGISEKAFGEYKEKVVEKLGVKKEGDLKDELAQDRMKTNPIEGQKVLIVGSGEVLCYDTASGRYFKSSMESIKRAENSVNYEILHHMYAPVSMFYDELGLPPTSFASQLGWNNENIMELEYTSTIAEDGQPCIVIDFKNPPINDFGKLY